MSYAKETVFSATIRHFINHVGEHKLHQDREVSVFAVTQQDLQRPRGPYGTKQPNEI